jgi:hypothetical protein
MASMDRHDKIEKINAEIARMEVEYELECVGKTTGNRNIGLDFKQYSDMGASINPFNWRIVTGKRTSKTEAEQVVAFHDRVLIEAINRLKLILRTENVTCVEFPALDITRHVDVTGWAGKYEPSSQWKVTVDGVEYIVFLFAKADVKMRICKIITGNRPTMVSIKELFCWSGDPKENVSKVISDVQGQIEKLHTTVDDKIIRQRG